MHTLSFQWQRRANTVFLLLVVYTLSFLPCAQAQVASAQTHLLAKDKRLDAIIPGFPEMLARDAKQIRIGRMLGWVEKRTRVHLNAEFDNLDEQTVFAVFDNVKASDLMDSIAALWLIPWEKDSPDSYRLIRPMREWDSFAPRDDYDRRRSTAGNAFMEGVEAAANSSTVRELTAGQTVEVSDLPRSLQQSIDDIVTAENEQRAARLEKPEPEHWDFSGATVQIGSSTSLKDLSVWQLNIVIPNRINSITMITNYEQCKKKYAAGKNSTVYAPVKFAITPTRAHELSELRRVVRLDMTNVTGEEVLQAMHNRYGINIIADAPLFLKSRTNVTINAETLADAFDELTRTFPGALWEYRPSGFFLLRGPNNPVQRTAD